LVYVERIGHDIRARTIVALAAGSRKNRSLRLLSFRPRDGRLGEQLENLKAVKRLVERAGGTFRVHCQLFGPQATTLVAVSEYKP
jgi:hypothetical protein